MEYECTNCDWVGENPAESNDGQGIPICPECGHEVEWYDDDYGDS